MSSDATWLPSMSEVYDRCLGPALFEPFAERMASAVAPLAPQRILELAAGTGIGTAALQRAVPGAEITATDLNPAMVSFAQRRVPGPTWLQADAQQLSFPDGSFDAVVCLFGVMFFPDKPAALAEARRVLRPSGTLHFSVWDVVQGSQFTHVMVQSLQAIFPEDTPDFIVRIPHGYTDSDQIRADVEAGGLHLANIERVTLRGPAPSAQSLAEGFCWGTPLRFELERRGDLGAIADALAQQMTQRLGDGPLIGEIAAILVTAQPTA